MAFKEKTWTIEMEVEEMSDTMEVEETTCTTDNMEEEETGTYTTEEMEVEETTCTTENMEVEEAIPVNSSSPGPAESMEVQEGATSGTDNKPIEISLAHIRYIVILL